MIFKRKSVSTDASVIFSSVITVSFELMLYMLQYKDSVRLKWYYDQKNHFYFFFGFRNVVYETHPMRNFRP